MPALSTPPFWAVPEDAVDSIKCISSSLNNKQFEMLFRPACKRAEKECVRVQKGMFLCLCKAKSVKQSVEGAAAQAYHLRESERYKRR